MATTPKKNAEETVDQDAEKAAAKKAPAKKPAASKSAGTKKTAAKASPEKDAAAEKPAPEAAAAEAKEPAEKKPAAKKAAAKKAPAASKAASAKKPAASKASTAKKASSSKGASSKASSSRKASTKSIKAKIFVEDEDGKRIVIDNGIAREDYAACALEDEEILGAFFESLRGNGRRIRQFSAAVIAVIAHENPEVVVPYIADLIDALDKPEAQTRWESLEALCALVPYLDEGVCADTVAGAEVSLDDEESGIARYKAFKYLCCLGAHSPRLSEMVWPSIDEAVQCYHGDPEFQDMLNELIAFARGDIDAGVKERLAARMSFDATNGKGALKRRAEAIVNACK